MWGGDTCVGRFLKEDLEDSAVLKEAAELTQR